MQIQISWLLQKPTDQDLHCLLGHVVFSKRMVKIISGCKNPTGKSSFRYYPLWAYHIRYGVVVAICSQLETLSLSDILRSGVQAFYFRFGSSGQPRELIKMAQPAQLHIKIVPWIDRFLKKLRVSLSFFPSLILCLIFSSVGWTARLELATSLRIPPRPPFSCMPKTIFNTIYLYACCMKLYLSFIT